MKTIVGLGNPGHNYRDTRHNIGFAVVQLLSERHQAPIRHQVLSAIDQRPACVYGDYQDGETPVRLLMPLTMMNESGHALRAVTVDLSDLLVVCDDVNLLLGTMRLRGQGSAGGHHGLESCLTALGTTDVARLRIGVGVPTLPRDLHEFVLSRFQSDERPLMQRMLTQAADACEMWVRHGIEMAMNRYNRTAEE